MRISVFGAGGAGGYFGGRLARAGEDVTFIARGQHLRAIREEGLRVESVKGDFVVRPARATDDPADVGEVDLVIVSVKAWQVPEVAQAMRPLVGPESCVLPLQNGVEASAQLVAVLGPDRVLGGLAWHNLRRGRTLLSKPVVLFRHEVECIRASEFVCHEDRFSSSISARRELSDERLMITGPITAYREVVIRAIATRRSRTQSGTCLVLAY